MAALRAFCLVLLALLFLNVWCEEAQDNSSGGNSSSSSTDSLLEEARKAAEDLFNPEKGRELIRNLTTQLADLGSHLGNLSQRLTEARDRAARVLQESMAAN